MRCESSPPANVRPVTTQSPIQIKAKRIGVAPILPTQRLNFKQYTAPARLCYVSTTFSGGCFYAGPITAPIHERMFETQSGRGLASLQDLADDRNVSFLAKRLGVPSVRAAFSDDGQYLLR